MKDDRIYLVHMLEAARRISTRLSAADRAAFDRNEDLQLAMTHLLQTIGEAARMVSEATRAQLPAIPWRQITGMRHRIVHDYLNIDFDVVWDTARIPFCSSNWSRRWYCLGIRAHRTDQGI